MRTLTFGPKCCRRWQTGSIFQNWFRIWKQRPRDMHTKQLTWQKLNKYTTHTQMELMREWSGETQGQPISKKGTKEERLGRSRTQGRANQTSIGQVGRNEQRRTPAEWRGGHAHWKKRSTKKHRGAESQSEELQWAEITSVLGIGRSVGSYKIQGATAPCGV